MDRRHFNLSMLGLLAGCGGNVEFPIQPTPARAGDQIHSDVPGYARIKWTPSVGGSATYSVQVGEATRIGNRVFFDCALVISALGTGSTTVISGLPIPAITYPNLDNQYICAVRANNIATAVVYIVGVITGGGSSIQLFSRTAANIDDAANAIFTGSATVQVTGQYEVNP